MTSEDLLDRALLNVQIFAQLNAINLTIANPQHTIRDQQASRDRGLLK